MTVKPIGSRKTTVKSTTVKKATPTCIVKKPAAQGIAKIKPTSISKKTKSDVVKTAKFNDAEFAKIVGKLINIYDPHDIFENAPTIGEDDNNYQQPIFPVPLSELAEALRKFLKDFIAKHSRQVNSKKAPSKKSKKATSKKKKK